MDWIQRDGESEARDASDRAMRQMQCVLEQSDRSLGGALHPAGRTGLARLTVSSGARMTDDGVASLSTLARIV
jgi:hypothetical protein